MHAQFGQRFSGREMKIAEHEIALDRRLIFGRMALEQHERHQQ